MAIGREEYSGHHIFLVAEKRMAFVEEIGVYFRKALETR
jgi:hypothetical protein